MIIPEYKPEEPHLLKRFLKHLEENQFSLLHKKQAIVRAKKAYEK